MAVYYDSDKKTWYCKFRYTDWTGKARSTTKRGFRTKREAKAYEVDYKRQSTETPDMTMRELCDKYIAAMSPRLRESTIISRKSDIKTYILPMLADIKISDITRNTIVEWQNWLMSQKAYGNKCSIAASTVNQRNRVLRIILNYAVTMEWLPNNPASAVSIVGKKQKREGFWTKDEYDRFIDAGKTDKDFPLYHLAYDVLFYSGMRLAEFRGLGGKSFDFEKDEIILDKGMDEAGNQIPLKNQQSYRRIPMPKAVMSRISVFLSSMYDIPSIGAFPTSARLLRSHMQRWSNAAGLPYIMIHGLRHSHVSFLISLNVPITIISRRIGHASPKVTLDTYSHMYEQDAHLVAEKLNEILDVGQNVVKDNDCP